MSVTSALKGSLRDGVVYAPVYIVPQLLSLITFSVITRVFSPSDYGLLTLVTATTSFLGILAVDWVKESIIRFFALYQKEDRLAAFYKIVIFTSSVSLGIWFVVSLASTLLLREQLGSRVQVLMLIGLLGLLLDSMAKTNLALLRVLGKVQTYTVIAVVQAGIRALFGIALALSFREVSAVLWASVISCLVILPFLFRESFPRDIKVSFDTKYETHHRRRDLKEFVFYGLPLLISSVSWYGLDMADRYLVQYFRGSHEVGVYNAGYSISTYGFIAIFALLGFSSYPVIVAMYEKQGKAAVQELLKGLNRYYFMLCVPAVFGISVLAKPIVRMLTGEAFFEAYTVIPFVATGAFFWGLLPFCSKPFVLLKRNGLYVTIVFANALLNILLNLVFIPYMGVLGAALATTLSYLSTFLSLWLVSEFAFHFSYSISIKSTVRILVSSVLMSLYLMLVVSRIFRGTWSVIIGVVTGAVVYSLVLLITGEISWKELRFVFERGQSESLAFSDGGNSDQVDHNEAEDGEYKNVG